MSHYPDTFTATLASVDAERDCAPVAAQVNGEATDLHAVADTQAPRRWTHGEIVAIVDERIAQALGCDVAPAADLALGDVFEADADIVGARYSGPELAPSVRIDAGTPLEITALGRDFATLSTADGIQVARTRSELLSGRDATGHAWRRVTVAPVSEPVCERCGGPKRDHAPGKACGVFVPTSGKVPPVASIEAAARAVASLWHTPVKAGWGVEWDNAIEELIAACGKESEAADPPPPPIMPRPRPLERRDPHTLARDVSERLRAAAGDVLDLPGLAATPMVDVTALRERAERAEAELARIPADVRGAMAALDNLAEYMREWLPSLPTTCRRLIDELLVASGRAEA